jgi:hypothetical protein
MMINQGKECDEVHDADMSEEDGARDVMNGEHAKSISGGQRNVSQVVSDVDEDENGR